MNPRDAASPPTDRSLDCSHRVPERRYGRALRLVLVITAGFMVVEFVAGWLANSLALLADAGHMLTDVAALALALFAAWIAQRPATPDKTYGYLRLEILAALVNGAVLFLVAGLIVWDAVGRLADPPAVEPRILFGVASAGLVVNIIGAYLLHGGRKESLNIRGAYLHVLGDLLGSIGAMAAGAVILLTGWLLADPIISVGIAVLILVGAWRLVRESVDVLLEATPRHIALGEVERLIATIPGVRDVHDLHVWTLTSGVIAMRVLETVQERMAGLGVHHVTMQIERNHLEPCDPGNSPNSVEVERGKAAAN
jgi:cobalt-zinc-cadmium efflux system protein